MEAFIYLEESHSGVRSIEKGNERMSGSQIVKTEVFPGPEEHGHNYLFLLQPPPLHPQPQSLFPPQFICERQVTE